MNIIEFPKLGLEFFINPEVITIGPITIYWYGIIMATAFLVSILLALKNAKKYNIDPDNLMDMLLYATPVAIICARIFYVAFNWNYYKDNLSETYMIWHGGIAIYGAVIGAVIVVVIFSKKKRINALSLMDYACVYLVLGQAIGRWGNFFNQELFGTNTELPWGMTGNVIRSSIIFEGMTNVSPDIPVHPVFLYESLWNFVAFAVLILVRNKKKFNGEIFALYMIFNGL